VYTGKKCTDILAEIAASIIRINEEAAHLKGVVVAGVLLQHPVLQIGAVTVGSLLFPVIASLCRTLRSWHPDGFI
jgi:hypothetical protein